MWCAGRNVSNGSPKIVAQALTYLHSRPSYSLSDGEILSYAWQHFATNVVPAFFGLNPQDTCTLELPVRRRHSVDSMENYTISEIAEEKLFCTYMVRSLDVHPLVACIAGGNVYVGNYEGIM